MAEIGKGGVVKTGTASSETDITSSCDSIDWPDEFNNEDTTSFGTTSDETSLPTTRGSDIKVSGNWSQAFDTTMRALLGVAGKSLVYGPIGTTTGYPRRTAPGYWKSFNLKQGAKGKIVWEGTFVKSGATTYDVY